MAKYCGQLINVGNVEPMPIKARPAAAPASEEEAMKWAGMTGGGKEISIKFKFPKGDRRFQDTLALVKTLPGRRWNPDGKNWTVPLLIGAYESLVEWDFELAPKLTEWYEKLTSPLSDDEFDIPGFETELGKGSKGLYPFQRKGVAFVQSREGRALIGDDMGLGKTAQALAWLQLNKDTALPALAIVPANVKLHWQRCCQNWTEIKTVVLYGRNGNGTTNIDAQSSGENTLTIINYDILDAWLPVLQKSKFKTIIGDEIHYIKNSQAARTKAFKKLAAKTKYFLPLSGTPIVNRPIEFFNCLSLLRRDLFNWYHYTQEYCNPEYNPFATQAMQRKEDTKARREGRASKKVKPIFDYKGASNTATLHRILSSTVMIRRMKKEVMPELPDKMRSVIPIELSNLAEYEQAEDDFLDEMEEHDLLWDVDREEEKANKQKAEALVRIEKLKQLAVKGKMASVISWIEDYLDSVDMKLVVFAWHQKVVDQLVTHFKDKVGTVKIDGRDSAEARQRAEDAFNTLSDVRLFVGNIKAAGVGISLRGSADTCFVELAWTPGEHDQAEDRVIGINRGLEGIDTSTAYYLLADKTVEEEIAHLLDKKRKVLAMILDGKKVKDTDLFKELLKVMRKRKGRKNA
jgi:SWI/SNF-related matrix-associated actin-dependent regulator 1 of chromatin subfamily A